MKTLTLLFSFGLLLLIYPKINAQQVISSAGISGSNASGSLSSTVGELVIDTKTAGSTTITQGFHQTKLTVTAINELPGLPFSVVVFPNPTQDQVLVKIEKENKQKLSYILFDLNGKAIQNGLLVNGQIGISFVSFNPSTYIIKILQEGKVIKTMKIVKE